MIKVNEIYKGSFYNFTRELPDNTFDLLFTDPPYGLGKHYRRQKSRANLANTKDYAKYSWDKKWSRRYINEIRRISKNQIIFGGNYYANWLPHSSGWIVWDKGNGDVNFADGELIWTSFDVGLKIYKWRWAGMCQEKMNRDKEERIYPTQKPVGLLKRIIHDFSKPGEIIIDPCTGSGSICVAAKQLGFDYVGIDKLKVACDLAKERLNNVSLDLFVDIPTKVKNLELFK